MYSKTEQKILEVLFIVGYSIAIGVILLEALGWLGGPLR